MTIQAIHHCGLVVRDLDRSIYFYHDLLGLPFANEPTGWMSGPALEAGVGVPGATLRQVALWAGEHSMMELIEYGNRPASSTQLGPEQLPRSRPRVLPVEDVRARKAELEAKGVQFYTDVNVVDEGPLAGWRWVYFSDPDGLALELVEIAYYLEEDAKEASVGRVPRARRPSLESIEANRWSEDDAVAIRTFGRTASTGKSASTWTGSARSGSLACSRPRGVVARRLAVLRLRQHPLHDRDPHRHVGDGQADPLRPAAARRRSDRVGLRFGRRATTSCTTRGSTTARHAGRRERRRPRRAGRISTLRGAFPPGRRARRRRRHQGLRRARRARSGERAARRRRRRDAGPRRAARPRASSVVDGQQVFLEARRIKTADEIRLLTQACSMVDAAYEELYRFLRPGVRENECVGLVAKTLLRPRVGVRRRGQRHLRRALLAAPARLLRPHHPPRRPGVLRHPAQPQRLPDVLLPHVRGRQRLAGAARRLQDLPRVHRPGDRTGQAGRHDRGHRAPSGRPATEFGFADEMAAFALQYGHGVGLSIWERPIFSRMISFDHPEVLEEGMVFALETYWPAADGWSASPASRRRWSSPPTGAR